MKCRSCKEDVPPKFAHALSVNVCPLCGQEIMEAKLQNVLAELKICLTDAQEYSEEVEDWLFSNYSFKKIKSNEVVVDKNQLERQVQTHAHTNANASVSHFTGKGPGVSVNRNEDEDLTVEDQPSIFAKRAGIGNHKKAIDFIKGRTSFGAADPSEFQGVDDEYGDVNGYSDDEDTNPLNVNERKQMANIFSQDDNKVSQEMQMQKLKRLQAASEGGGGFFRRT
jgi:hypothetical protein